MSIKEYYTNNKQYGNRYNTDAQFTDIIYERKYNGVMDKQARFIEENQLLNEEDWYLFVHQFESLADDKDRGWRGEYFGKMMRGACMTYLYTKSERLYNLLLSVVEKMLESQDEKGRFSTYSQPLEFNGWDMWCRKYVLLGFLHFHEICKDISLKEKIENALSKHLDYLCERIGEGKISIGETAPDLYAINASSILEPTMRMYNITGKESYLEFARHIVDYLAKGPANIFSLALENKLLPYQYPVTKAYEMMSCFEGLLEFYRATGEEKWRTAVINFVDSVERSEITLIGGAGCHHELFNHSAQMQTDTDYKGVMLETCVTVTWMKLCNQLLQLTGDAKYADYIEKSFYNAIYGAVNTKKNTTNGGFLFDSYSPVTLGLRGRQIGGYKDISETKYCGCCAAIGAAGTALPLLTAVTTTKNGIAVNYYEAGNITINGFKLAIDTEYPANGNVKILVEEASEDKKEILLRVPAFSGENTKIYINSAYHPIADNGAEGFYALIYREWKKGDVIEIAFDMNPRIVRPLGVDEKPETKNFFAVLYGPLVLARDAKLTTVGGSVKLSDNLKVEPKSKDGFDCVLRASVSLGNEELDMIDYSSAGKTWDEASLMEAWIKCE